MLQKQENTECQNPDYKLMSKLFRGDKKKPDLLKREDGVLQPIEGGPCMELEKKPSSAESTTIFHLSHSLLFW